MEQAKQQMAPLSVSVEESARILGISRSATYELIAQGEIKTFKIGRRRLALASELKAFIARSKSRRTVKCEMNKEWGLRRAAREIAKAVLEHRLSENTLDSTNVKGKL